MQIVIEATSVQNPLAEGWRRAFEAVGISAVGIDIGKEGLDLPNGWHRAESKDAIAAIRQSTAVISWWGLGSLNHLYSNTVSKDIKTCLILDTFPNASRMSTEIRERLRARLQPVRPNLVVTYSDIMSEQLRKARIFGASTEIRNLLQPFPLSMHREGPAYRDPGSLIFTGRADLLYNRSTSMRKDSLGGFLEGFIKDGLSVRVQEPRDPDSRQFLVSRGYKFYPYMTNEDVLRGSLAEVIVEHEFQLCYYNACSRTIRRRMAGGMSSRFALGLTANTPIILPREAKSSLSFVLDKAIGAEVNEPRDIGTPDERLFESWKSNHFQWSAEGQRSELWKIATP